MLVYDCTVCFSCILVDTLSTRVKGRWKMHSLFLYISGSKINPMVEGASILKEIHSLAVCVLSAHVYESQKLYMRTVFPLDTNSFEREFMIS